MQDFQPAQRRLPAPGEARSCCESKDCCRQDWDAAERDNDPCCLRRLGNYHRLEARACLHCTAPCPRCWHDVPGYPVPSIFPLLLSKDVVVVAVVVVVVYIGVFVVSLMFQVSMSPATMIIIQLLIKS